jgi:hypothetical protein
VKKKVILVLAGLVAIAALICGSGYLLFMRGDGGSVTSLSGTSGTILSIRAVCFPVNVAAPGCASWKCRGSSLVLKSLCHATNSMLRDCCQGVAGSCKRFLGTELSVNDLIVPVNATADRDGIAAAPGTEDLPLVEETANDDNDTTEALSPQPALPASSPAVPVTPAVMKTIPVNPALGSYDPSIALPNIPVAIAILPSGKVCCVAAGAVCAD